MNLILTDKCTNTCPYCFAAQEMAKNLKQNNMKRDIFDAFINFVDESKESIDINLIGGEPLIYDDLEYVLKSVHNSVYITSFSVLTGGVVSKDKFELLLPYKSKMKLMFNLNESHTYLNPGHHKIVVENIAYAIELGIATTIGYNIYHQNFNANEIIDYCNKFGVNILRFSVACPIYGQKSNMVVPSAEYKSLSDKVYNFLETCYYNDIEAILDCPIPLCFFSDEQLGKLSKMHPMVVSRMGQCTPPIDINYDLSVFRCFALSNESKVNLTDFETFKDIKKYFLDEVDSRLISPTVYEECKNCSYRKKCNGGCLANNCGFIKSPTKTDRIVEALNIAQQGDIKEAITRVISERELSSPELLLASRLYESISDSENSKLFAQRVVNNMSAPELVQRALELLK